MKIISRYTPQLEFMISLYVFEEKSLCKKVDLGTKWRKKVSGTLPASFSSELERKDVSDTLTWIHRCIQDGLTDGESIEDLLNWVKEKSISLSDAPSVPVVDNSALVLSDVYPLLVTWNEQYFSKLSHGILEGLQKKHEEVQQLIERKQEDIDIINLVTNGFSLKSHPEDLEVILIPQYHARPVVLFHKEEGAHFYQYAADEIVGEDDVLPPIMLRMQQALSDENRLQILRFIATDHRTFKEIHEFIGLAKSTVHHHLITLRASGLVHLLVAPGKPEVYTFREQALKEMEGRLLDYIYSKPR